MEELALFYPQGHERHFEHGHPERPERVETMRRALQEGGWWDQGHQVESRGLSDRFLAKIHKEHYLKRLREVSASGTRLDMDTYTTTASWDLARSAAGGAVAVARTVWLGEAAVGLALTRPPGHHATPGRGMGFCLLNNVALAAQYLLDLNGESHPPADRLAIIDLDLHHGNGTQDIFWQRQDVFYISTHQYPHYPGSGRVEEIGSGSGEGYTANFPLPPYSGDRAFSTIMDEGIIPLLDRYQPQMLLVSFGFDSHWRDPLGYLLLSAAVYGQLIARLVSWAESNCQGRIALFLEGGYDLDAGAVCAQAVAAALLKQTWNDPLGPATQSETDRWMSMLQRAQQIWQI